MAKGKPEKQRWGKKAHPNSGRAVCRWENAKFRGKKLYLGSANKPLPGVEALGWGRGTQELHGVQAGWCLHFLQVVGNRNPLAGGFFPSSLSFFNRQKGTLRRLCFRQGNLQGI